MNKAKGSMNVSKAGWQGGNATSARHGREFYEQIGYKGGPKKDGVHMRYSIEAQRKF
ncbi:Em GEA1 (EM1) [Azotobacter armeniacus]